MTVAWNQTNMCPSDNPKAEYDRYAEMQESMGELDGSSVL